jgi:hypothetical protein
VRGATLGWVHGFLTFLIGSISRPFFIKIDVAKSLGHFEFLKFPENQKYVNTRNFYTADSITQINGFCGKSRKSLKYMVEELIMMQICWKMIQYGYIFDISITFPNRDVELVPIAQTLESSRCRRLLSSLHLCFFLACYLICVSFKRFQLICLSSSCLVCFTEYVHVSRFIQWLLHFTSCFRLICINSD